MNQFETLLFSECNLLAIRDFSASVGYNLLKILIITIVSSYFEKEIRLFKVYNKIFYLISITKFPLKIENNLIVLIL